MKRSLIHLLLAAFFTTVLTGYSQADFDYIRYTVKANEDPRDIALTHLNSASTGLDIIMRVNRISSPNSINAGDILFIPKGIEKVESMKVLAEEKLQAAREMLAITYAADASKQSHDLYNAAGLEHEKGNFENAIRKYKLSSVWAERALETARQKAIVDLEVVLAAKSGLVQNSIDSGKSWKTMLDLDTSPAGSWIRTSKGGSAHLEFPDNSVYELMESTTIELVELTKNRAKDSLRTSIALHSGEYLGKVKKISGDRRHDNIGLQASGLAILIRGTTVRVTKNGNLSTLAVTEGKTQTMTPGNAPVDIDNGFGLKALDLNGVWNLQVVKLPAAPQVDPKFLNVQTPNPNPGLNWAGVANAQSYRFELSTKKDFSSLLEQRELVALNLVPQNALKPAEYFWRVTARNNGVLGYTSPVQRLEIIRGLNFNILVQQPMQKVAGIPVSGPNNKFRVLATDADSGVVGFEYSWNGSAYQTMINGLPVPQTSGVHIFHARSFAANGLRSDIRTMKFRVDADAPTVSHSTEKRGNILSVRFKAQDDAGVKTLEIREADGSISPLANNALKEIDTKHGGSITLRAIDMLGNASAFKTYRYSPGYSPGL